MRRTLRSLFALAVGALAALTVLTGPARADVPPPKGFVESCTVEKQQKDGEECVLCNGAYHGDRDFCVRQYEPQSYELRCRTRGASVWGEVWCRKAGEGAAPAPTAPEPPATPAPAAPTAPTAPPPENSPPPEGGASE